MNKLFSLLITLLVFSSSLFAQDVEKVKVKIEAMNKAYTQAMIDNDVDKMMSMYSDDIISMPSYQPTVKGLTKVRELSELQANSGWKTTHFEMNMTDIMLAGNLAIEIGNYNMKMSGPNAPEWADYGKYLTVWEEQKDGSMKIKVETWNTDTNPWAQMDESKQEEMQKTE
ncbi:MAG: nuclear transport factor 2 family protein [Ignavibacteriales bacterium]|nr:nuclear transport factor 2 family protein [Ignavibacteriales bacterium]